VIQSSFSVDGDFHEARRTVMSFPFEPSRSALLSMDCQTGIVERYTKNDESFVHRAAAVLAAARDAKMKVIHVQAGFRANFPEISARNTLFSSIKTSAWHQQMFQGPKGAIHPALAPRGDEVVVTKHRVGAFTGTDLDMILRANEIGTIVLLGIATSGVVLSTLVDAFDLDYRVVVVKDACTDLDRDLHDCLINRFFPARASVISAGEFQGALPR
jgi:nicotinamidase-related amidase